MDFARVAHNFSLRILVLPASIGLVAVSLTSCSGSGKPVSDSAPSAQSAGHVAACGFIGACTRGNNPVPVNAPSPANSTASASTNDASAQASWPQAENQELHAAYTVTEGYAADPAKMRRGPADANVSRAVSTQPSKTAETTVALTSFTRSSGSASGAFAQSSRALQ